MVELIPVMIGIMLAQIAPGPNMMAVSSMSLSAGRRPGIITAAGIASGVFIWSILFAFGIGAVVVAFPGMMLVMKLLGGAYFLYLSIRSLRACLGRRKQNPAGPKPGENNQPNFSVTSSQTAGRSAYRTGLLVVLTNPKAALMWAAVSMFMASSHSTHLMFVGLGFVASLTALTIYGGYAVLFSTGVAMRTYQRFFRAIEAAFGAVFGAIGIKLVVDGLRQLRA